MLTRRTFLRNAALSGAAWAVRDALAGPGIGAAPLNVVYISGDDVRADAFQALGNGAVRTPHLDRLAAQGSVFTRAACGNPICVPSRTELLTGRCQVSESVERMRRFDPAWTTWSQAMKQAGWATSFSGKWDLRISPWKAGYARTAGLFSGGGAPAIATVDRDFNGRKVTGYVGFTFKSDADQPLPEFGVGLTPTTDQTIADHAIAALRRISGGPFFCHINFTSAHDPRLWPAGVEPRIDPRDLRLPGNFRPQHPFATGNLGGRDEILIPAPRSPDDVLKERAVYFACVENLDRQIGRVMRALADQGVLDRTLVIVAADHGLALGCHGLMGKQNQYEHTMNVPLVIAGPGIPRGRRLAAQVCLRDLYPTVCELAGVAVPATVQGRSFAPLLRDRQTDIHEAVFGYWNRFQRMVRRNDGWKLIHYPDIGRRQLFNVSDDPLELRDLSGSASRQALLRDMQRQLAAWQREHGDRAGLA